MWHCVKDIAAHRKLPVEELLSFAMQQANRFGVVDTDEDPKISTFDVRDLVNAFKHHNTADELHPAGGSLESAAR